MHPMLPLGIVLCMNGPLGLSIGASRAFGRLYNKLLLVRSKPCLEGAKLYDISLAILQADFLTGSPLL
jgi:hypothetical protein